MNPTNKNHNNNYNEQDDIIKQFLELPAETTKRNTEKPNHNIKAYKHFTLKQLNHHKQRQHLQHLIDANKIPFGFKFDVQTNLPLSPQLKRVGGTAHELKQTFY